MSDLFEDLDNFTNQLDKGKKPSQAAVPQKMAADFTYDVKPQGGKPLAGQSLYSQQQQPPMQTKQNISSYQAKPTGVQMAAPAQKFQMPDLGRGKLAVVQDDEYLAHYENDIKLRVTEYLKWMKTFQDAEGGLEAIGKSYEKYGLNLKANGDLEYNEWAPGAKGLTIFGDFNAWNRDEFRCAKNEYGTFSITLKANADGTPKIKHLQKYKIQIEGGDGQKRDRNSPWARYSIQDKSTFLYDNVFYNPPQQFQWTHKRPAPQPKQSDRIYEAHVGMAQEEGKVSSYRDFADYNLDRIKEHGYNVVQLMAIQEHSYYASFGYHVTSFFGISSRSGTPDDFKYLVNKAHSMGIRIVIDLVHSHASNNMNDGILNFDGTDHCFSHSGPAGYHSGWDSMLFDYSKYEVKRFLLSNLSYFLTEFNVDGYRFDAITSILYHHHGIGVGFTGNYAEYFGLQTDLEGIVYVMLANTLIRLINPDALTIAEDVSGMPTLCRKICDGGMGFDYRLSMFMPDMWIKLLDGTPDEDWSMGHICHSLTNRRWKEKVIGYAESHDQAIVGDKTQSMWLFDSEIYTGMSINQDFTFRVSRGMALHKMIRLISQSLGGQGYLNFMGNEFGHPEWIDFPREGNSDSYHYCRRQWGLMYNKELRYGQLAAWDKMMNTNEILFGSMCHEHEFVSMQSDEEKIIVYEKGDLLFIFNFHPNKSYEHYPVGTLWDSDHFIVYESDEQRFGGHQRLNDAHNTWYEAYHEKTNGRPRKLHIYIPSRCAIILCAYENAVKKSPPPKMPAVTDRQRGQAKGGMGAMGMAQQPVGMIAQPISQPKAQVSSLPPASMQQHQSAYQVPQNELDQMIGQKKVNAGLSYDKLEASPEKSSELNTVNKKFKDMMADFE